MHAHVAHDVCTMGWGSINESSLLLSLLAYLGDNATLCASNLDALVCCRADRQAGVWSNGQIQLVNGTGDHT
jgi:hypothetical protein